VCITLFYRIFTTHTLLLCPSHGIHAPATAHTRKQDGKPDSAQFNQGTEQTHADNFEYVMHGRVFKIDGGKGAAATLEVFASFGGLLMSLKGEPRSLQQIEVDQRIYCLLKRVHAE
jgi:DNA-directed RNA polymerase I, II, and III subunit RPABC3